MMFLSEIDPITLLPIVPIAFATAVFHSVGGFAGGLPLMIGLAPILGVKETVPAVAAAMIVSKVTRLWVFRRAVAWRAVAAILSTALPGIVLGALLYVTLPVHLVAVVLGLFLIASVPPRRTLKSRDLKVGLGGLRLVGVPYGFISGTTIGAGIMLAPFLLGAGL